MSLTSYRAAPPRVNLGLSVSGVSETDERARFGGAPFGLVSQRGSVSFVLGRPGGDLLSQVLRHSTIGAEVFDGRVRDGIGSDHLAKATRPAKDREVLKR